MLDEAGMGEGPMDVPSPLERTRIELELLVRGSLTIDRSREDPRSEHQPPPATSIAEPPNTVRNQAGSQLAHSEIPVRGQEQARTWHRPRAASYPGRCTSTGGARVVHDAAPGPRGRDDDGPRDAEGLAVIGRPAEIVAELAEEI